MRVRGFTVVEVVVCVVLMALILSVTWRVAATQRRGFARLVERQDVLAAERTVGWVLATEVASARAGRDRRVASPDVLELRAFRGRGFACAERATSEGWLPVRATGWRRVEPAKDSVVVRDADGRRAVLDLLERRSGAAPCGPGPEGDVEWWRLAGADGLRPVLLRYFERGSYHLEDGALRYRRGRAGRQPLTAEVLDGTRSGLAELGAAIVVRFRPAVREDPSGAAVYEAGDSGWVRAYRAP